ncbi:penicillin acylase family protein [Candidatus Bipolaricaulota bacterium]
MSGNRAYGVGISALPWGDSVPHRLIVRSTAVCLLVLVAASLMLGTSMAPEPEVEIIRDAWGIPHIFADSDEGAMYGLGYVSAQDRMLQMEYCRRIVQGRISEMLGLVGSPGKTTLDSDTKNRHMGTYRHLETVAAHLDEETQRLLQAYSDGVNHYLSTTRTLHPLFADFGIIPEPWQPADCLAVWNRIATFFSPSWTGEAKRLHDYEDLLLEEGSESEAIAQLTTKRILDEAAAAVQFSDADPAFLAALDAYVAELALASIPLQEMLAAEVIPTFSHAWVVGGERTTTGAAVLNSDPQTAVRNPSVWYEAYVSGETFTARGIGVAGCPGFLIGWNNTVAWGVTALGADLADTFRLELSTSERNAYVYDGAQYPIETWQEAIPVRDGRSATITLKRTHLGPVVSELMTDRRRNEEYVLRTIDQEYESQHTVQALFSMMRSHDSRTFAAALEPWTSPGVHCLFGDSEGSIGYWTLAGIPVRSSLSPFGGQATQDGSLSAAGWLDIIPHDLLPHVFDPASGVLFSGNHLPVGSWYPLSLGVGTGGSGDSQRSWRLRELLSGDGLLSPEDAQAIHFDDVNAAIRSIVRAGLHADAMGQALSQNAVLALNHLFQWYASGAHCDTSDPSFAVAYHVARGFRQPQAGALYDRYGGGDGGLCFFLKDLNARLDANPQLTLDAAELAYIDASLAAGWTTATTKYGGDATRWQQNFASSTATLALPYGVNLEGFPTLDRTLNLLSAPLHDPEGATIWAQKGNSYSQWVDLADVDRSLAVLPIGISELPSSPYFAAEKELWETGTLRAAPLSREMIEGASIVLSFPDS